LFAPSLVDPGIVLKNNKKTKIEKKELNCNISKLDTLPQVDARGL
jgi:hypothetical protein